VHALVARIPRGRVATYGQLSKLIDGRLSAVGVGWALAACKEDLPWQRVVNARGGISTEGKVPDLQRDLLESEGVRFRPDGTVDLTRYQWPGPRSRKTAGLSPPPRPRRQSVSDRRRRSR
jgi:methylated-DNA-protein-cysteine methyltransferase-like protein